MNSYSNKVIILIISFLIYFSSQFIFIASADNNLENNIDAIFNIEFISGTQLIIDIKADVEKITLTANDQSYYKDDILKKYENDLEVMGAIKYVLKNSFTNQLKIIFNKTSIHSFNELPQFNEGIFYDRYSINFTANYFNFNNQVNISDFINGILRMGAFVNYTFDLVAESGWNNTYNFILSDSIGYHRTTGIVNENIIQWIIENDNQNGFSKIAEISLKLNDPLSDYKENNVEFEFNVDLNEQSRLNVSVIVNSINLSNLIKIPDFISNLHNIPSDGVRLFIRNNLSTWQDLYQKIIKNIIDEIKPKIESPPFNQTISFKFKWDINSTTNCTQPYNVNNMDNYPPIIANFFDNDIDIIICGISSKAFLGFINSGASSNITSSDINFGNNLKNINYPYQIKLRLPENITSKNKNVILWNKSNNELGNISSNNYRKYNEEKIDTNFEIYFKSTDLNILSIFTGETKLSFGLFVKETQNRNVTQLPYYFIIPEKIDVDYFNSDLLRLCIDENIFDNSTINSFLLSEKESYESRLKNIFPNLDINGFTDDDLFYNSLKWDDDINKMDNYNPIKISTFSNILYELPFKFKILFPTIDIMEQNFTLSGIKNQNVKYKIIFPAGIKIKLYNESNKLSLNITDDGKYYIELNFNKNQSELNEYISFKIMPSFLFIISLFLPCIISLLITMILVIIIYIIRRKRRVNKQFSIRQKKEKNNTGNEVEYYVPPPPK
jgi:hypothetical protein